MKNTSNIIADLLATIERQERENEQLKSSLRESQRCNNLLTDITKEAIKNINLSVSLSRKKDNGNGGHNSFFSGNN